MHKYLMKLGGLTGCHQMPERSFFISGYQFPICARCFGVLIGQTLGLLLYFMYLPNFMVLLLLILPLVVDWMLQFFLVAESTNIRRLISGILCGYALETINVFVIILCIKAVLRLINVNSGIISAQFDRSVCHLFG